MRLIAPFAFLARPTAKLVGRWPRLHAMATLAPPKPVQVKIPEVTPARGARRGRVGFLQGCVQRVFFGDVNHATVGVLAAEGFEVWTPKAPRCCGALQLHTGVDAKDRARETIEVFEGCDRVVVNAAGCGSAMKDYGHLFREDPQWAERAKAFAEKVCDVHELLAEHEPVAERHPIEMAVAYHDACHLAHAQGVRSQPRELLRSIPGLELREPDGWEICCGSAGVYNLLNPEPAAELGRRKAEKINATGAQLVAAANPGCALQIAAHGGPRVLHPMQILHAAIEGRTP